MWRGGGGGGFFFIFFVFLLCGGGGGGGAQLLRVTKGKNLELPGANREEGKEAEMEGKEDKCAGWMAGTQAQAFLWPHSFPL